MNGKLGSASVVIYFVNHTDPNHWPGYVAMAPYSACPTPEGWSRHEADDLPSIRRLEDKLNEDALREWQQDYYREAAGIGALQQRKRDQMYSKLFSSETSEYDKEYIREWLKLKDEQKREKFKAAFEHRAVILYQLHNDIPKNRNANEERVDLDRLTVKD